MVRLTTAAAALLVYMASFSSGLKVVVLHGKGASGAIYRKRMRPMIEETHSKLGRSNVDFVFLDAPHVIDTGNDAGFFEWWRLPPGVRSFNAKEYMGIEESLSLIKKQEPYDVLIGHSQGAILSSIVIANSLSKQRENVCKGAILSGAAYPAPYRKLLDSLQANCYPNSLHCIGMNDDINPPEDAMSIKRIFGGRELMHNMGHVMPLDSASIDIYTEFLKEML